MHGHSAKPSVPRTPATRELEPFKAQFKKWYIDDDYTLAEVQQLFKEQYNLDVVLKRWERRRRQWNILKTRSTGPSSTASNNPEPDTPKDDEGAHSPMVPSINYAANLQPEMLAPSSSGEVCAQLGLSKAMAYAPAQSNFDARYESVQQPWGYRDSQIHYPTRNNASQAITQPPWRLQTHMDCQTFRSNQSPPQHHYPDPMPYLGSYPMVRQGPMVPNNYEELPTYRPSNTLHHSSNENWHNQ